MVHTHLLFAAAEYLRSLGQDPKAIARQVGMAAEATESADAEVSIERQAAFFDRASELCADPHFCLSVAEHRVTGMFGLLEFLLRSSATMSEVFERARRYFSVLNPASSLRIVRDGPEMELHHAVTGSRNGLGRHGNELAMAVMLRLAREYSGKEWRPKALWFSHPAPPALERLTRYFGCERIEFDRDSNGFRLPAAHLELDVLRSDPALASFLELQAREKASAIPSPEDLVGQVEEAIRRELPDGTPSIERLARKLEMSARTLQRRLEERGTGFTPVLERVRRDLADRYLAESERSLSQVAFLLGYSDVTTFLRAYKRWTGKTPGRIRQAR